MWMEVRLIFPFYFLLCRTLISFFTKKKRIVMENRRKRQIRAEWDKEWGKLNTEGNIWWLGGAKANWEYRMGRNRWGWFCENTSFFFIYLSIVFSFHFEFEKLFAFMLF